MVAHGGAVFHGDAVGLVDILALVTLGGELEIHELVAQPRQGFVQYGLNIHFTPRKQKNGPVAIFLGN